MTLSGLDSPVGWPTPAGGWPEWVSTVPHVGNRHPKPTAIAPIEEGANCQRYAYALLDLFGIKVPPHRILEPDRDEGDRPHLGQIGVGEGHLLRMPHSKPLAEGIYELRFTCERTARRITYVLDSERQAITLPTFRKQRNNERREVLRARRMKRNHDEERQER